MKSSMGLLSRGSADTDTEHSEGWQPWTLSYWLNIIIVSVEIGFAVTIVVIDRLSAVRNGLVQVDSDTSPFLLQPLFNNYHSLLWTSLPTFIFSLYSLVWTAIITDNTNRQPYIELMRGNNAERSVMLDYAATALWKSWYVALKYGHFHLSAGLVLGFVNSVVVGPLAAHLLVQRSALSATSITLPSTTSLNFSAIDSKTNLQPFIDIATSVQTYNSSPPAWMTDSLAFDRFSVPPSTSSGNITANVSAYSALLECQIIQPNDYTIAYDNSSETEQSASISFNDRGCSSRQAFAVSSNTPVYVRSWYSFCQTDRVNRFGTVSALYSAAERQLTNLTLISCVPTYWQTNGTLTMSYTANYHSIPPSFVSFVGNSQTQMSPGLQILLENILPSYTIFNPSASTSANAVGFSIYSAAQRRSTSLPLSVSQSLSIPAAPDPQILLNSTRDVYATIYAAVVRNLLLQDKSGPATQQDRAPASSSSAQATLTTTSQRLFVSKPIAYTILTAVLLNLICHMVLFIYAKRHRTMLNEEPLGLLGKAKILRRSDLAEVVDRWEGRYGTDSMQERMRKEKVFGLGREMCWWDEEESRIRIDGMGIGGVGTDGSGGSRDARASRE